MSAAGKDDKRVLFCYFLVYFATVILIYVVRSGLNLQLPLTPLLTSAVTALGVSFLFVLAVRKYLWKLSLVRVGLGIKVPIIHGRWEGYIRSSYTQHKVEHPIAIEFHQDLDSVRVWYYDGNAVTNSIIADFAVEPTGGPLRLYCIYSNQPIRTDQIRLQAHHGVMELYVDPTWRRISGIYYNNPHQRATYGEIALKFMTRRLKGRF